MFEAMSRLRQRRQHRHFNKTPMASKLASVLIFTADANATAPPLHQLDTAERSIRHADFACRSQSSMDALDDARRTLRSAYIAMQQGHMDMARKLAEQSSFHARCIRIEAEQAQAAPAGNPHDTEAGPGGETVIFCIREVSTQQSSQTGMAPTDNAVGISLSKD